MAMNQTASKAATHTIVPLKDRHPAGAPSKTAKPVVTAKKKVAIKRPDVNLVAALRAGLPRTIAVQLAKHPVVVVELWSSHDPVGALAAGEARTGAGNAGAGYVAVDVDVDGGAASEVTRVLGKVPAAPAALIYTRPATLVTTLTGFNDSTVVQQAAVSANPKLTVDTTAAAPAVK